MFTLSRVLLNTKPQVKAASKACEGLCTWVLAMEVYERVIKVVKPKQAKLAEAEAELAVQMEKLQGKQAELKEVEDALKVLNDQVSPLSLTSVFPWVYQ